MGGSTSKQPKQSQQNYSHQKHTVNDVVDINVLFNQKEPEIIHQFEMFYTKCSTFKTSTNEFHSTNQVEVSNFKIIEKLEKKGIEANEIGMRVLLDLDKYVGLNEENRNKRKQHVIEIQKELDHVENLLTDLRTLKRSNEGQIKDKQSEDCINSNLNDNCIEVNEQI
ncbi:BAG domain-containing protein [Entamoeba marina]